MWYVVAWTWCRSAGWLQGSDELLPLRCLCVGWYWPSYWQISYFRCSGIYCSYEKQVYLFWYIPLYKVNLLFIVPVFHQPSCFQPELPAIWFYVIVKYYHHVMTIISLIYHNKEISYLEICSNYKFFCFYKHHFFIILVAYVLKLMSLVHHCTNSWLSTGPTLLPSWILYMEGHLDNLSSPDFIYLLGLSLFTILHNEQDVFC